jgi:hypothetical protein
VPRAVYRVAWMVCDRINSGEKMIFPCVIIQLIVDYIGEHLGTGQGLPYIYEGVRPIGARHNRIKSIQSNLFTLFFLALGVEVT